MGENVIDIRVEFLASSEEGNSIISPVDEYQGAYFTVIGGGDDEAQNALGKRIADIVNSYPALARKAEALQREKAELAKAVMEVLNAVRDYLPPDGISAKDCLSRVIGAVDNSDINPLIKKLERADVDA